MLEPNALRGTIHQSPSAAQDYAATRNQVAVVSKGVGGRELRDVEPLAATALMARTATLFKRLADIDAFELELDGVTSDELVECVTVLSGTIGGIDLGAMKVLGCVDVERQRQVRLDIPVCCAAQRGTAIVVVAALLNGLEIAGKSLADVQVVIDGREQREQHALSFCAQLVSTIHRYRSLIREGWSIQSGKTSRAIYANSRL